MMIQQCKTLAFKVKGSESFMGAKVPGSSREGSYKMQKCECAKVKKYKMWKIDAKYFAICILHLHSEPIFQLTLIGSPSTTRFPMSLRWPSYVAPKSSPKGGGLKNAKWLFSFWNRTSLEESLLQSFFVW